MNTAETELATLILNAASQTAARFNAGDTLLFVEAYDKLMIAADRSLPSRGIPCNPGAEKYTTEEVVYAADGSVNIVTKDHATAVLPDLGEPTPIQPIPAGRTRRTKAQIEADRIAAEQAAGPAQTPAEVGNGANTATEVATSTPTQSSESAAAPTEPAAEGDPPFTAIDLSTLFNTVRLSVSDAERPKYVQKVKEKLQELGLKTVSTCPDDKIAELRALIDSFKA